ncbi:MAG TPA: hypothetical protein VNB49_10575 [Candidatus Dormibacteraeota bacterium]|nr:hypothetical protein [Candidatus Dormibacteraeota bacterium]
MPNKHLPPTVDSAGVVRPGLPRGIALGTRGSSGVEAADVESNPNAYIALSLIQLDKNFNELKKQLEDASKPVDEYRPQTITADSESIVTVQPNWEYPEKITSVIITGPAGNVTVQLGDRVWALTIPASGIIVIAPVGIMLSRSDTRQLTASTPGDYSLELMGTADVRWG